MMKKIYISDLDGTLLKNDGTLSTFSKKKLKELLLNGINFTIASARSLVSIKEIMVDLPFRLPVIEFNGGLISDYHTGKHKIINEINPEVTNDLLDLIKKSNLMPSISAIKDKEDKLYYENIINQGMGLYFQDRIQADDPRVSKIDKLENILDTRIISFNIVGKKDILKELENKLNENFARFITVNFFENMYAPGWYWLTLQDHKATKADGIKLLLNEYNFSSNDLTVFGDNTNDINMFKLASDAIAVENALDELKKHATRVIGTNEEDSVVKYLEESIGS